MKNSRFVLIYSKATKKNNIIYVVYLQNYLEGKRDGGGGGGEETSPPAKRSTVARVDADCDRRVAHG